MMMWRQRWQVSSSSHLRSMRKRSIDTTADSSASEEQGGGQPAKRRHDACAVARSLRLSELPCAALHLLAPEVATALRTAEALVTCQPSPSGDALEEAKAAADAARESTFPHLDDSHHSSAYAAASLLFAGCLLMEASAAPSPLTASEAATAALRALDLAMLRAGVDEWAAAAAPLVRQAGAFRISHDAAEHASGTSSGAGQAHSPADPMQAARTGWERACAHFTDDAHAHSIERVDARTLSVDEFRNRHMEVGGGLPPRPVILTHALETWPALSSRPWSMHYLKEAAGSRLVPVETYASKDATSTYLSDSWAQRVMTFAEYIDLYIIKSAPHRSGDADEEESATERGYLAQHQLFEQIPSLRDDIHTPSFCDVWTAEDSAAPDGCETRRLPVVSAWIGPGGTVSPLHTDPYHNLLAQVSGHKYIRLYDSQHSPRLYPRSGALCNNCYVDLDHPPTPAERPLFEGTPFHQCILGPGELLYIPRHAWHYVRALEASLSVSFWWGARMALTCVDGVVAAHY